MEHVTTIFAGHIESPKKEFVVEFFHPKYFNVFWQGGKRRIIKVLAQTADGAIKIAKYHFYSGSDFHLKKN
jgi:hypothetical protein